MDLSKNLEIGNNLTHDQMELLRSGFGIVGIENIPNVPKLCDYLDAKSTFDTVELPDRLTEPVRQLSRLVLLNELEHMRGLVSQGRTDELSIRVTSRFGILEKINLLKDII